MTSACKSNSVLPSMPGHRPISSSNAPLRSHPERWPRPTLFARRSCILPRLYPRRSALERLPILGLWRGLRQRLDSSLVGAGPGRSPFSDVKSECDGPLRVRFGREATAGNSARRSDAAPSPTCRRNRGDRDTPQSTGSRARGAAAAANRPASAPSPESRASYGRTRMVCGPALPPSPPNGPKMLTDANATAWPP
jgi:hypothetical protein